MEIEGAYGVLPGEAFYAFRTGQTVWVSQEGEEGAKHALNNAVNGESPRVKWFTEISRLDAEGFKEPLQFWVK